MLAPSGLVAVAAISRYASALDGLARALGADEAFVRIRDRDLRDGQHRNDSGRPDYFTTAYFHRPDDLREELEAAGFEDVGVYGVEGPGWMVADFERRWQDPVLRRDFLQVAAALEREPSVIGASAHSARHRAEARELNRWTAPTPRPARGSRPSPSSGRCRWSAPTTGAARCLRVRDRVEAVRWC